MCMPEQKRSVSAYFFSRGGHGPAGGRGRKTVPALSMTVFYQI